MRKYVLEFIRRGLISCSFGPLILAVIYLILQHHGILQDITINQVCMGIFSLSALAFVAGGINVIHQIERIPLMMAILIHGGVLYICYLVTYLINGWFQDGMAPILIFTVIFVVGYLVIWLIILYVTKKRTDKLNEVLKKKQQSME
jgi:hypothetical protein